MGKVEVRPSPPRRCFQYVGFHCARILVPTVPWAYGGVRTNGGPVRTRGTLGGMRASRSERLEVRLAPGELEAWRAAAPGGNVSAWLRGLATRELAGASVPPARSAPSVPPPVPVLSVAPPSAVDPAACAHPRDLRRSRGWGTVCGVCGRLVGCFR